jgi:hypothetical protein
MFVIYYLKEILQKTLVLTYEQIMYIMIMIVNIKKTYYKCLNIWRNNKWDETRAEMVQARRKKKYH